MKVIYPSNNDNSQNPVYKYAYEYNISGCFKKESITDPLGNITDYCYDSLERINKIKLPDPGNGHTVSSLT